MEQQVDNEENGDKTVNGFDKRIQELEMEKRKQREEFDAQRAKMKELYLQKEDELKRCSNEKANLLSEMAKLQSELDEARSQLVVAGFRIESEYEVLQRKAQEEIATLQQLVHETVEESTSSRSIYDVELHKLQTVIQQLLHENQELKSGRQSSPHHSTQDSTPSLAPSAVLKTLVRKFGPDSFTTQDSTEDPNKKPEEDPEILKSLVEHLKEEIQALKGKLRSTDEQLQICKQNAHSNEPDGKPDSTAMPSGDSPHKTSVASAVAPPCVMCSNYEAQLVKEQKRALDLEASLAAAERASERHKEELLKEIGFRKDMEEKWNEKREEHRLQVAELTRRTDCAEQDLAEIRQTFSQTYTEVQDSLCSLTNGRENVQQELEKLQKENDLLVGKYSIHSQQLQSEIINLPDTVEELQEQLLKQHQELVIAKVGKETAEEQCETLKYDIVLLRDQITNDQQNMDSLENNLVSEINTLKMQTEQLENEKKHLLGVQQKLKSLEKLYEEDMKIKKRYEESNSELRSRVASLQQELDTSETVQKDFVSLSQNLQMQLEKIRESDTQVRWQHEDDVDDCTACKVPFQANKKKKEHCRHCGQIFCLSCLSHNIPSGPNQRLTKVCDVCHTLLDKSSAPYFSTEAPHCSDYDSDYKRLV